MITVFIGTTNRLETLDRTVKSYKQMTTPHELVIVDNGTDDPQCIALLDKLEKRVKKIYRLPGCNSMEEATNNFNFAIRDQFDTTGGEWFAVSEADVCFDGTDPDAFNVYIELADRFKRAVGPHLRVDENIPSHYPLRSRVLACETWMLYKRDMDERNGVFFSSTQIDTTFHLFSRRPFFKRFHLDPIRVGPPYDAMHLDWYLNIFKPNKENSIYIDGNRPVGSWGKQWIRDFWFWFQDDPEKAFQLLLNEPLNPRDICNNAFLRSWCYQYGNGCERDLGKSERWLETAIPTSDTRYYWPHEENWKAMIYENDFRSLGWSKEKGV